ncbi:Nuclear envelope morphology protein 1 [Quaeritorhiza haematococci]|nr:Nuclear envelope morphology protein 1 [Quaeritorhiza haematococci]
MLSGGRKRNQQRFPTSYPSMNPVDKATSPRAGGSARLRERRVGQRHGFTSTDASSTGELDSDSSASEPSHDLVSSGSAYRHTIHRGVPFPKRTKTLVLDLDETLIHSTSRGSRNHDHVIEVLIDKHACLYYVYKRPHVDFFLKKVSEWYNVVIFTASMPEYADPVIDWLDGNRGLISKRYFRQSCTQHLGTYVKNLSVVEPDLSQVALVDNSPISYAMNKDNGIPIEGWISDPHDEALLDLLPFLDALRFTEDVRSILSFRI